MVLSDDLPLGQLDLRYMPLPTGTATSGQVPVATGVGNASAWGGGSGVTVLTRATVLTASGSAAANTIVPVDTTSSAVTVTLPTAPAQGTIVAVKCIIFGSGHNVTIATGGSDVFNKTGGGTTLSLAAVNQGVYLCYDTATAIWTDLADDLPLSYLDTLFLQLTGGTMSGAIAMGSNKITGLTNGSGAQDAAAYGQTLAGGSLAPLTTEGDLLYANATPAAARLAVGSANQVLGVSGGVPAWQAGIGLQATTGYTGYTLINGTGTIVSWTAPNDGALHRFEIFARLIVSSNLTGGAIFAGNGGTVLTGGTINSGAFLWSANQGAGDYFLTKTSLGVSGILGPAEQIYIKQSTAITGGAAILYAEIWAS